MERRFAVLLAFACVLVAALPTLYAYLATPSGLRYTGFQTNADDHMVYAAWTWQAAHGSFLFDNRFAVDPQPGLTFHLYFLLVGQLARLTGVVAAMTLARLLFSGLFVLLLARLVRRLRPGVYGTKLTLAAAIVAGGVGFLPGFWHRFGIEWPVDVWQPEGFVVPSMLTNGLFMVSLCLIVSVFLCVLRVRRNDLGGVVLGALAMAALMNVHSYDALLVGLVLLAFLGASLASRTMTTGWIFRATLIVLGAVAPALWFVHVLGEDPVFRVRAATPTYSPNFRLVLLGFLPPIALALFGIYRRAASSEERRRRLAGLALAVVTILTFLVMSQGHTGGYFLTPVGWGASFLAMAAAAALLAERSPARNLIVAWALVGTVAIYFPALFQRKLTMGLAIPWGLLAALAVTDLIERKDRSTRNLVTLAVLLTLGLTSFQWTFREVWYASNDVSSTTRHPVYLGPDVQRIIAYLNARSGRRVAIAMPGAAQPIPDGQGGRLPDGFATPSLPDVAPFLSGLAGVYTFDGHWSETPDYDARAGQSTRFFLSAPIGNAMPLSDEARRALVERWDLGYAVVPIGEPFVLPETLGEVVVPGTQFALVRLNR